ncbi:succinylglutamate desuccinylase/aspartoacylase family protein [Paraburkholderia sabiae]|uniref:Succinylglutamate desuccinylase/aspartoacylase family protein n=1 Tax=Paraburkholderia sabiae TaxID=273251 RepID=A0ABU9QT11_9BURK|nr:succinylglutamate desuccinylase/aspartoacylase family protein [Paraburkholderia sabiae]WJZ79542.1 succinylglutamate desuccinylase/aspartoacylase family protein [Paraburkholderia sabiae]WJZ79550.1 succinylglutamate desuccinylase/aspartoacylase family protein [Paraburkholderia sabiae]CAD6563390.1 N-alpha-acetyl-L-2,4-diaminobutyric acid deacetylase [Paraburkholderia sabiae]
MSTPTRIWTPVDFDRDGKQTGSLRLPISSDLSAYGWIPIPVVCIRNGNGPTAVLIAGTHGDEYEGQVALLELARSIEASTITGRILILPALNFPAVEAGRRVSPIDEGNLNRLYPGEAHGTATQMIAHYVTTVLLPMADLVVDLHSGGRSLDYVSCALVRPCADRQLDERQMEMLRVFGAPIGYVTDGKGGGGNTTLPAAAEPLGVPVITAELGGGAMLRADGKELARLAVLRLLDHMGIRTDRTLPQPEETRVMVSQSGSLYAESDGLFEPAAMPGDEVTAGQHAGYLHSIERPTDSPINLTFGTSGLVACRRFPTLTKRGDCLYTFMRDIEGGVQK